MNNSRQRTLFRATGLFFLMISAFLTQAQIVNWQNKDLNTDSVFGISTERAYTLLLKKKKPHTVVVAVIDSGIDTTQEDLQKSLWINLKEIPGNGIDDDHNGYADDIHGWNFIGGPKGDVDQDNLEMTPLIREHKAYYDSLSASSIPAAGQAGYDNFRKMEKAYDEEFKKATAMVDGIGRFRSILDEIVKKIGKDSLSVADFQNFQPSGDGEKKVQTVIIRGLQKNPDYKSLRAKEIDGAYNHYKDQLDFELNTHFDPRPIVGDDYNNSRQRDYGNSDVFGSHADHGTHVAGIIGATRNNGIGIDGIADHVQIMSVRAVPDGDERDKDIANAIRYAVDNGARVINMSFGKAYSKDKAAVDDAVKYAMSKDVLLVHAAGNEGEDLDDPGNIVVPNKYYADSSGMAAGWIQVGASGAKDDSTLVAGFSNYGKNTVDVFAPGVQITSSVPGNHYKSFSGTSMASPVVAGLAALIREYYPRLTAVQVKEIIMGSVVKRESLKEKCIAGGVVNAYNALQLAATY